VGKRAIAFEPLPELAIFNFIEVVNYLTPHFVAYLVFVPIDESNKALPPEHKESELLGQPLYAGFALRCRLFYRLSYLSLTSIRPVSEVNQAKNGRT
jgi:hypothetical protein